MKIRINKNMYISKSPKRFTFQKDSYLSRRALEGKTVENDEVTKAMTEFYESFAREKDDKEKDESWKINNLEYDLRTTEWILNKVRQSKSYSQNLYAALCNNDFVKNEVWPILVENRWSCSWRYAGGIISDMREEGDYIDWYCSGIKWNKEMDDEIFTQLSVEEKEQFLETKNYVNESLVTDEIRQDLLKLGWIVITDEENQV